MVWSSWFSMNSTHIAAARVQTWPCWFVGSRIGFQGRKSSLCIGTSATMSNAENDEARNTAVAEVGSKLFGEPMGPNSIIDEHLARVTDPTAHGSSLGKSLRDAVTAEMSSNISNKELFAHPLACWIETEVGLIEGEKLRRRPPMTLADAADKLALATKVDAGKCVNATAMMHRPAEAKIHQ